MANPRMSDDELTTARQILNEVRNGISETTKGDQKFGFALRRYVYKKLSYDERGSPAHRAKLKKLKLIEQKGQCAYHRCPVPGKKLSKDDEPELDRRDAIKGYTSENTEIVHHGCHRQSQVDKGFQ
jgi:hypothetical protein